jgi:hypothetical protein
MGDAGFGDLFEASPDGLEGLDVLCNALFPPWPRRVKVLPEAAPRAGDRCPQQAVWVIYSGDCLFQSGKRGDVILDGQPDDFAPVGYPAGHAQL